ncbi:hypothetical protein [Oceanobacillus halotolerans]|uniref:hypothetical protein n=1 Tax=Oceanobacillus halotolerans TaxID=2663380 RepID=UPI0013DAD833|nr:hypothetical protein [Oceanobacillus halotolerans]
MKRKNFYENLTNELLGCFYCYVMDRLNQGNHLKLLNYERQLIEKVAKKRGISLLELRIIGHWFIQKEVNLVKEENQEY